LDASYDKEESFYKDEDLELELVEKVALKMGTLANYSACQVEFIR